MGLDVSFFRKPKLRPEDGIPLNLLSQQKMPDMVSAELDLLYRFSKVLERDFWEVLYDAVHDFLEEFDTLYGAKEVKYFGRRREAGWMLDYFGYTENASYLHITKEQLKAFIDYMSDLLEKHRVREGDDYVVPFFEKRIEGLNVTYVDMHGIYCKCREVMDTFDWEHFDLIFYASW